MKAMLLTLATLLPTSAFAGADGEYYCKGNFDTSESMVLVVKVKGQVLEGDEGRAHVVVRDGRKTLFAGNAVVTTEDVMLWLNATKGRNRLQGTIFMDELDQTQIELNGEEMNFDCN